MREFQRSHGLGVRGEDERQQGRLDTMRSFYFLTYNPDPKLVSVIDYDLGGFDDQCIFEGSCPPGGVPDEVKLYVDASKQWHDFINNPLGWMIVSTPFKDAMTPFWKGGEFCPIELRDRDGDGVFGGFWLGTMGRRIACMDMERSEYREREPGDLEAVTKLVVRADSVPPDAHVFTLAEYVPEVLVDDEVPCVPT